LHLALGLAAMVPVLALPPLASAKGYGSFRVVSESGKVGLIRGASAKAFWSDLETWHTGSCICMSVMGAARFEDRLMRRARWKFHLDGDWPRGVMLIQSGHSSPLLYYPASRTTPAYVVAPAGSANGSGKPRLSWDDWKVVTPRMQGIIDAALRHGAVSTAASSASFPTGWAVAGGLGAILLAALILSAWRGLDPSARIRHGRVRLAP
jgi:predicted dehydrogenase